jgi:SAM-dependent methyltransferase
MGAEAYQRIEDIGVVATNPDLDRMPIKKPILSKTSRALVTLNSHGFDVVTTEKNWVIQAFLKFCHEHPGAFVLDVGSGYGALSRAALETGVKVISNDREMDHLLISRSQVTDKEQLSRLYLHNKIFPRLNIPYNSLEAVMLHRVLAFLSGSEIDLGLEYMHNWLKPGGMVYIVTMAPQHVAFKGSFDLIYGRKAREGEKWPGMSMEVAKYLPDQAYALPNLLHVIDQNIMIKALTRHGFEIVNNGYVSMKVFGTEEDRDGQEAIGVIARKKVKN